MIRGYQTANVGKILFISVNLPFQEDDLASLCESFPVSSLTWYTAIVFAKDLNGQFIFYETNLHLLCFLLHKS